MRHRGIILLFLGNVKKKMKEKFEIEKIGNRLRKIRKELGNTLEQMGEITGLSKSGI